jgi:beta propeller repeat protein
MTLKAIFFHVLSFVVLINVFNSAEGVTLVPPHTDIFPFHSESMPINIGIGDAYTIHSTSDTGAIRQVCFAQTYLAGTKKIQALDEIHKQFFVDEDGYYRISFNGHTSGKVYIVSSSLVGNAKGGADAQIEATIYGADNSTILSPLYNTERSLGDIYDDVKKTYDELNMIIELQGVKLAETIINEIIDAFEAANNPTYQWDEKPYSLSTTVYLEAGKSYYWLLNINSSADSIAALNACNATGMVIDLVLEELVAIPLEPSDNPRIERFYITPSSVAQGDLFVLAVEASDSDGQLTKAEFYRDINGNGQIDVSVDQMVGEDTNYNLGFGYMGYANLSMGSYQYLVRVQDDDGHWSDSATTQLTVSSSPAILGSFLSIEGHDWNADEEGDEDGVIETREDVRLGIRLKSSAEIHGFFANLSSSNGNLDISDDTEQYPPLAAGEEAWQYGSGFDMYLDASSTTTVPFTLYADYTIDGQDYYQNLTFNKTFNAPVDAEFEIVSYTIDDSTARKTYNNGDGIIQSGEDIEIRPKLKNTGEAGATDIEAWLTYSGTVLSVDEFPSTENYPDLDPGQEKDPETGDNFDIEDIHRDYAGTQVVDFHLTYDQSDAEVTLPDAITLDIQPAAWLKVPEDYWDFGAAFPDTLILHTTQIQNNGSENLTITSISTSNADTTWDGVSLPLIIAPGTSRDLEITIDTTGLNGSMTREVIVNSDGRVGKPGEDDKLIISGIVGNLAPVFTVPIVTAANDPDISGNWIVWQDYRNENGDIFAFDTATEVEHQITADTNMQRNPVISGNLIVWEDDRNNPGSDDTDIYAYDMDKPELGVFPVSAVSPWEEDAIGVDNGLVAVRRGYEWLYDDNNPNVVHNIHVYEYDGNGGFSEIWSTGFTPGSGDNPRQSIPYRSYSDLNKGFLVFRQSEFYMNIQSDGDRYWDARNTAAYTIDFEAGDTLKSKAFDGSPDMATAASHRFVYTKRSDDGDDEIWLWRTDGTSEHIVGLVDEDAANDVLAIGGPDSEDIVVYDWNDSYRPGLWYIDRGNGDQEGAITTSGDARYLRADNYGLVWIDDDSDKIRYTYLKEPEIAVSVVEVSFDTETPIEGDTIDVSALVSNISEYNLTNDITVRLYDGNPDTEGVQIGVEQVISGGIVGNGQQTVNFTDVVIPDGAGGSDEEQFHLYVRISVPGYDNPVNNTANSSISVYDNDTQGPSISNFLVEEYNGDGDGTIGADEQIKISWGLDDLSGIGAIALSVDGSPINLGGNYYAILNPLDAGEHNLSISVTDTDSSPVSSLYDYSFNVVVAEKLTVTYNDTSITNASTITVADIFVGTSILFIVKNDGEQTLTLEGLTINVTQGDIALLGPMTSSLQEGSSTYFTIDISNIGLFGGVISLANSDANENPFTFTVSGESIPIDTDNDGTPDLNDAFPINPTESSDIDEDGIGDNADTDDDNDGISDSVEAAGSNDGDANNDGIQDSLQNNVVCLESYTAQGYVILETPEGITLSNCQATNNPSLGDAPAEMNFDYGFYDFTISGLTPGGSTTLTMTLPSSTTVDTYYKYGQTLADQTDHWYEFLYDNETGAEINGNVITLYFTDSLRGDDVLTQDSRVVDLGAPGFKASGGDNPDDDDDDDDDNDGGGGCFIELLRY